MNTRYGNSLNYNFGGFGLQDGGMWNWMNEHFDVVFGYAESYGAQIGGGIEKGIAARVNFYSTVRNDFEWSIRKGVEGGSYNIGEKVNWGIGGAYYGGIDYKGQTYNGVTEHEVGIGIIGLGVKLKFDNSGKMIDWFWGFDPSLNMQFIGGIEANFRIGFSKREK
ncbi:MAG: hypothetical protein EOO42_17285 [Flavobacteriales bacterium]|nr:MAG: hypothetical protein EOO42_17285 [Flavobacteriales bacterium]